MNIKFAGVALGALVLGLTGISQAKADAIGYASLDFSAGFFSMPGTSQPVDLTGSVTINNLQDRLTNSAGLDDQSGSTFATRNAANSGATIDPSQVSYGNNPNGENSFGFTNQNTNFARSDSQLTGSLLAGNIVSNATSEVQVTGDHVGTASTTATSNSRETFTANQNMTLQFNVGGTIALYAKNYNSASQMQTSDAIIQFTVTLTDNTTGTQILNFSPTELNKEMSALATPESEGGPTADAFFLASDAFTLIAGHTYTLAISESVQADATAVPEPGTLALFGIGLAGLGFLSFRRQKRNGGGFAA